MPTFKAIEFLDGGAFFQFCPIFSDFETWHEVCSATYAVKRPMDWVTTNNHYDINQRKPSSQRSWP